MLYLLCSKESVDSMKKELNRESNFELLRIVSMIFIILHHLMVHSNYNLGLDINVQKFILSIFRCGGKLGVVLYVMITGYYMINKKGIKIKKLVGLELQVLFYSIILFIIFKVFGNLNITSEMVSKLFFPNISKTYWFFSSYFILYLCIPYLNKLIINISKRDFQKLLLIGFVFFDFYTICCCL